jgi:hypothetical protein
MQKNGDHPAGPVVRAVVISNAFQKHIISAEAQDKRFYQQNRRITKALSFVAPGSLP